MFIRKHPELTFYIVLYGLTAVTITVGVLAGWSGTTLGTAVLAVMSVTFVVRALLD